MGILFENAALWGRAVARGQTPKSDFIEAFEVVLASFEGIDDAGRQRLRAAVGDGFRAGLAAGRAS